MSVKYFIKKKSNLGYDLHFVPSETLLTQWSCAKPDLQLIANLCRLNILAEIQNAGSGHPGSSLSVIDLLVSLFAHKDYSPLSSNSLIFSSKGHDSPAIYAALHSIGQITDSDLMSFRKFGGLPGHPEVGRAGIPTSTGSLGMGISKAKGFIYADRLNGVSRKIVTILGDGELQEGQIWESLMSASRDNLSNLIAIVDANKIQSDTWVEATLPLGDLEKRVIGSGWNYYECDGHSFASMHKILDLILTSDKPSFLVANTVKGFGSVLTENFSKSHKFYNFHSGALSEDQYSTVSKEILNKIEGVIHTKESIIKNDILGNHPKKRPESLVSEWGRLLPRYMEKWKEIVVLDADLSYDTGTYTIRESFDERYLQCGIAEQDMVSISGTMALSGLTPIVHSFATFLTMRATEQIFNNYTEKTKIIYMGFLSGILPAQPGSSHQAVTDIQIMSAFPNLQIVEPADGRELDESFQEAMARSTPTYFRINSVGSLKFCREIIKQIGFINLRKAGTKLLILSSGVTLTAEIVQSKLIADERISIATRPNISSPYSKEEIEFLLSFSTIIVLENYLPGNGLYNLTLTALSPERSNVIRVGISEIPQSGENEKVLNYHKLDSENLETLVSRFL